MASGGCQCGAVRFSAASFKDNCHVCHCRMCQKATGNFFAPLIGVPNADLTWTRGAPSIFNSSAHVDRGFCSRCGTPLFYRSNEEAHTSIMLGAFDEPEHLQLRYQIGMEGCLPQVAQMATLSPIGRTEDIDTKGSAQIRSTNRQHPDHDTASWPLD